MDNQIVRTATVNRVTKETRIRCTLCLDGSGQYDINTGIGFFDHMLSGFARHGLFDLTLTCEGDLEIDSHHTIEDCGIVLGECIRQAVGDKKAIRRFCHVILPMDEALILCAVDLSGRPYYQSDLAFTVPVIGQMDTEMVKEFFYSVSYAGMMNLHFKQFTGHGFIGIIGRDGKNRLPDHFSERKCRDLHRAVHLDDRVIADELFCVQELP